MYNTKKRLQLYIDNNMIIVVPPNNPLSIIDVHNKLNLVFLKRNFS